MAKDAFYFSHDSNAKDDPKCILLIENEGMEGYGIFWALIESLRHEAESKLPLAILPALARRWNCSKDKVEAVIKKYDLFSLDDKYFFSNRLNRSMMEFNERKLRLSEAGKRGNEKRYRSQGDRHPITKSSPPDTNPIALKESKVKESKVNINTESKDSRGPAAIDPLKTEYKQIGKDKGSIINFIQLKKPQFFEPYFDLWNFFAGERKLPKAAERTTARERQFLIRIKEKGFDFIKILAAAKSSEFILQGNWFTLDFILKSEANYTKVLEGNYQQKTEKKINGQSQQTPTREGQKLAEAMAEIQATASGPGN